MELGEVCGCGWGLKGDDVGFTSRSRGPGPLPYAHSPNPYDAALVCQGGSKTGTPINATIAMLVATAAIAFFTKLAILSDLLSISTLFIFMLVALALLVRRYYIAGETSAENRNKLIVFLVVILASSAATSGYWALVEDGWVSYCVTVPVWLLATAAIAFLVPQARKPRLWGVPLVPWLPSASIAINIFLLGSIDKDSFIRFGIWTGILLVYYLVLGLHASYDTAKAIQAKATEDGAYRKVEEGQDSSTTKLGSDAAST